MNASDDVTANEIEDDLVKRYGIVLTSANLVKALGYPTEGAYQQALSRDTFPVPVFPMDNRKGLFALARDVARYLASQRLRSKARPNSTSVRRSEVSTPEAGGDLIGAP